MRLNRAPIGHMRFHGEVLKKALNVWKKTIRHEQRPLTYIFGD